MASSRTKGSQSLTEISLPASVQRVIEAKVDSWQEWEGDDEQCTIRGGLPYSRAPREGASRLIEAVAEAAGSEALTHRLEAIRPALVELLRKTSIDDLEEQLAHPKFGKGEVVRKVDGKIEVRFASGLRTLASG